MFELCGVFVISLHDLIVACPFDKYFSYILYVRGTPNPYLN